MSDNENDTDRLAAPFETDESSYNPAVMGQMGSGTTYPKNSADSESDSPDGGGKGGSSQ